MAHLSGFPRNPEIPRNTVFGPEIPELPLGGSGTGNFSVNTFSGNCERLPRVRTHAREAAKHFPSLGSLSLPNKGFAIRSLTGLRCIKSPINRRVVGGMPC